MKIILNQTSKTDAKNRKFFQVECPTCHTPRVCREDTIKHSTQCKGCSRKTHGLEGTPIYSVWLAMKGRCYNPNNARFNNYGARGITVCDEWLNDFAAFNRWAELNGYTANLTIERVNNDLGYSPINCKWITAEEQMLNRQLLQSNNTTGYRGVSRNGKKFQVDCNGIYLGKFDTAEQAAKIREQYIIDNGLPFQLNF